MVLSWLRSLLARERVVTQQHVKYLRQERTKVWINPTYKPPTDPDWDLMRTGRYEEAANVFLQRSKEGLPAWRNRGLAFLCLGRYSAAYEAFAEADRIERERHPLHSRALAEMGICLWLEGRRNEALPLIEENLHLRMSNKLAYGDFAGGAQEGLFGYYAGVSFPDDRLTAMAIRHLTKISRSKRHRGWPKPIANYLVGRSSLDDTLLEAAESSNIDTAVEHAKVDTLSCRQLTQALFYAAIKQRAQGDMLSCRTLMRRVITLPNSVVELERFIAEHEVKATINPID